MPLSYPVNKTTKLIRRHAESEKPMWKTEELRQVQLCHRQQEAALRGFAEPA